jgi:hypothetical protein
VTGQRSNSGQPHRLNYVISSFPCLLYRRPRTTPSSPPPPPSTQPPSTVLPFDAPRYMRLHFLMNPPTVTATTSGMSAPLRCTSQWDSMCKRSFRQDYIDDAPTDPRSGRK